ncbi:MAG: sigma-70 family RNA polymerase sigma factor [Hyphomicrobiaceae bacterium]|nr:sigma-70 family RNA polymerase sigma factor [Hyphomicrobiaceae bacterium]MCC0010111.1 sigma-70 family RNA polymerase sigma factor [Hyphomicrobiaceae bacterium]
MTLDDTDADLIARVAALDQLALRTLIGRHQVRLYRFLMRLVRDEAMAEELTNEVFMEVWRNASRYEGRSQVGTWLLSIGRNRAISRLRKRREFSWDEDAAAEIVDDDDDPEVTAQKRDKAAALRRCLEGLSNEHREIVDLVYYQEKSVGEVAEIVGIPENTVKTRLFYARKKLSELMQTQGIDRGWP